MNHKVTCCGVLCQKTEIEEKTGFLSLLNIVSALHVIISPEEIDHLGTRQRGIKTPVHFVLIWDRVKISNNEKKDLHFSCEIDFFDPNDNLVMTDMKLDVSIPAEADRYYSVFNFARGVITSIPGKHFLRVTCIDSEDPHKTILCEYPLDIHMSGIDGHRVLPPVHNKK